MPQMSPMWWTTMLMWMIMCMLMMMSISYFEYQPKLEIFKKNKLSKMTWKW
uniref:ATP synthase F0 subunit 8 n=2 Tax=Cicadellidae TaxID=30102 RepID=A0A7M4CCI5_9HEMI|nr:ATP synthase F0 subunit 8 [Penthimia melanocephala]QOG08892.1 ATP synthase F0 subunit 8 [Penthimia melanocephala]UGK73272.1 ATP synthase F0 subunit 8 [Cicadellidae sp. 'Neodcortus squaras']